MIDLEPIEQPDEHPQMVEPPPFTPLPEDHPQVAEPAPDDEVFEEPRELEEPAPIEYERANSTHYAIGQLGQQPRMVLTANYVSDAQTQLQPGEVILILDEVPTSRCRIKEDLSGLEEIPPTLAERQAARWEEAKVYRNFRQTTTCMTTFGLIDVDEVRSLGRINTTVAKALRARDAGEWFYVTWTMATGTTQELEGEQFLTMADEVFDFIDQCQTVATGIKELIFTSEDPEAVDYTTGYPA